MRGYLAGSGLKEYRKSGTVCGIALPAGLRNADPPAGAHLHPVHQGRGGRTTRTSTSPPWPRLIGPDLAARVREVSLALYRRGRELALERGILLADTKFEFGLLRGGELILIDEVLTPDSSRYWLAECLAARAPTRPAWTSSSCGTTWRPCPDWNKQPPAPHLPEDVIEGVRSRYLDLAARFGIPV